jgi:hypothetical protein
MLNPYHARVIAIFPESATLSTLIWLCQQGMSSISSKRLKYQPSLDTRVEDIPWREHVYMLSGLFYPGRFMPDNVTESYNLDARILKFRFPTTLVTGEPFYGSIHVQLPTYVKSLELWCLVIEARFTSGYRTLGRQNKITIRQCYGRVRLLSVYTITLPNNHLLLL